ncbi:MAG TPA: hypothetical protein PLM38_04285, partial [Ottowia sp.]|nr:hypothetical protein [Ottowia sp.]
MEQKEAHDDRNHPPGRSDFSDFCFAVVEQRRRVALVRLGVNYFRLRTNGDFLPDRVQCVGWSGGLAMKVSMPSALIS